MKHRRANQETQLDKVRREQALIARVAKKGAGFVSDELIRERRAEAKREK